MARDKTQCPRCECGCGQDTVASKRARKDRGLAKGDRPRFILRHNMRGKSNPNWVGGRITKIDGRVMILDSDHPRSDKRGYVAEHIVIATTVLGKNLPAGSCIHHVNGDPGDNRNSNLVVCQDNRYHKLLHQRARALAACGHADWLKCQFCGNHGPKETMYTYPKQNIGHHRSCYNRYASARKDHHGIN